MVKIEINERFRQALELMEKSRKNVFITGRAGTGKSTLLEYFRATTDKEVAVLAPTGVAAVNVRGQTIHSFFRFKPDITPAKVKKIKKKSDLNLYRNLDAVVIDEISMARADLLDCVDRFLRLNGKEADRPFGGLPMIFIGDLYQLPPVVTSREAAAFRGEYASPYFFDAAVLRDPEFAMEFIELEKVYRQKDDDFIALLNAIRNNTATDKELEALNRRVRPGFHPPSQESYIHLTTTNARAREINERRLTDLKGKERRYHGEMTGDFDAHALPADLDLALKTGAQVMLLNNDSTGRWVNGTIGAVTEIVRGTDGDPDTVVVDIPGQGEVPVGPNQWDLFRFVWDEGARTLDSEVVGSFTQYPLKLAWAVTIHKSQGKTFDRVVVDLERPTFAPGQLYVALSRCTTLDGMVLTRPLRKRDILIDYRVVKFVTHFQYGLSARDCPTEKKVDIIRRAIDARSPLEITYLKASDVKSRRVVHPREVGEMEYLGKPFLGMSALDELRGEERVFRVDRILEIHSPAGVTG